MVIDRVVARLVSTLAQDNIVSYMLITIYTTYYILLATKLLANVLTKPILRTEFTI
ncbi:MAG: hypothetical protein HQK49_02090 [Oligoflexia bacterium]|nr:hypothetical protein [Oligoflexia bacterium]